MVNSNAIIRLTKKKQTFDLSCTSARDRINSLSEIINFKIRFLPEYKARTNDEFKSLEVENVYWRKTKTIGKKVAEIIDRLPTTFKIGKFKYKWVGGVTFHQKGSGRLYGLIKEDSAESYCQIHKWLQKHADKFPYYSQLLLQQKESGIPIDTGNIEESRFLNGFNLLLDYEVARRLVAEDDPHKDLPIINYMKFIINNLDKFEELIVGKKESVCEIPKNPWQTWDNNLSLVTGDRRDVVAKAFIPQLNSTSSKAAMRHDLANLHQDDEDSGDEYSGDEDEGDICFYPEMKLTEQIDQQLKALSEEYRRSLRNADSKVGEVLSGGDLELKMIANLLGLNINVYQRGYDSRNRPKKDGKKNVIERSLSISSEGGKPVSLFLSSKRHYHLYNIYNPESKLTESLANTSPNPANSLFSALLRAKNSKIPFEIYSDDLVITIEDISKLRGKIADVLDDFAANGDDRIYKLFVNIFIAINKEEYQRAVSSLPPSSLRDKVTELRKNFFSKQPQDLDEKNDIEKEPRDITEQSVVIGPRYIPGWVLHDVADNGNCFYEAVADQL